MMVIPTLILLHFLWFAGAGLAVCALSWAFRHAQIIIQTRSQRRRALLNLARQLESGVVLSAWKTFAQSGNGGPVCQATQGFRFIENGSGGRGSRRAATKEIASSSMRFSRSFALPKDYPL
ncbi:MAG TPA: hypothetical protein VNQ76_16170 [Planctomicrobium sp.]|nr:hypothetical protein [Planctomicrobium sp.]